MKSTSSTSSSSSCMCSTIDSGRGLALAVGALFAGRSLLLRNTKHPTARIKTRIMTNATLATISPISQSRSELGEEDGPWVTVVDGGAVGAIGRREKVGDVMVVHSKLNTL